MEGEKAQAWFKDVLSWCEEDKGTALCYTLSYGGIFPIDKSWSNEPSYSEVKAGPASQDWELCIT